LIVTSFEANRGIANMQLDHDRSRKIEAEMPLAIGHIELVRNFWTAPIDTFGTARAHHLELSLLPRSTIAHGNFPEHWGPHRFEPIGEMFLLPADYRVHAKSDCRHQNSIVCNFDPAAVSTWFGDLQWTDCRLQGSLDIANNSIRNLLFRIREEIRSPGFASQTIVELMAGQIAIELSRHLMGIDDNRPIGGLAPWRLRLIDERLADDKAPPSLTELAELCNLSVRHLTRAFRASRGRSIGSYVAEHRIDLAKRLLATGMCIKSVAYSTGFTAPSNFAAAFARATGETPRQYKQRASRKNVDTPLRSKPLKVH
jgi:AraC family transcriptional regulator